jgi:hypothetical protein
MDEKRTPEDNLFDHNLAQDRLAKRLAGRNREFGFVSISDMLTDIRDKHAAPGDQDDFDDAEW